MRIVGNNPQLSRQTQATASGAITGGKPVVVNTDGTVSGAGGATNSAGTPVIFEADFDSSDHAGVTFDSNSNRIVIAYYDPENSNYGTAIVGTIDPSDNSISYGTPVVFNSGTSQYVTATFDSNSNKVVIAFRHQDGDGAGIVGTVDPSDNSISFGSSAKFSGGSFVTFTTITFDSTLNKIVIAYKRPNTNYGTCVIGTVSGTSISFGTPVVFNSAETQFIATTYDSSNQRVVIFYMDSGNSNYGTAIVGTVSGTGISFGSEVVFSSGIARGMSTVFDTNSNKVFVAWSSGIDDTIKSIIGTVSGTGISFGSAVQIDSNISDGYETGSAFDSNTNKVVVTYSDEGSSSKGTAIVGTVSGTSVSYETAFVFETGSTRICYTEGAVFDSNANRVLTIYVDVDNSNSGTSAVIQTSSTNLTSENFIGFAEDTVATGQPVTVNTKGAIVDNILQLESASSSLGSESIYASVTARYPNAVFDNSNNRVVIGYTDGSNSNYGTAVVGSVSGTDISFGTPVVFESASIGSVFYAPDLAFDSNSNKVVIAYPDGGNSNLPTAIVGTVDPSDNSISFGTAATLQASGAANVDMSIAFDSNSNKVLIVYRDGGNSNYKTGIVGTVSGTNISFGTKAVVVSSPAGYNSVAFDSNSNKFAIFYADDSNGHGKCKVATISGTDVTYGSEATYASASSKYPQSTFDSSNNKIVLAFEDDDNSDYATAIVGTISGTDITFGTEAVINQGNIQNIFNHSITFATGINKIIHFARDGADGDHGKVHIGTVSGTGISFGSTILVNGGDALLGVTATFDSNLKKAVLAFMDEGNSNYGTAVVLTPAGTLEDLTPAQTYFVQTDGTLSETADSPSVTAGTAVAGSTLIVKG